MSITESEYSYFLAIKNRLQALRPRPGTREAEQLEFYTIKCRWYEWERQRPPADSTPPDSDRYYELLSRVLTPSPQATAPAPIARLREGDSGTIGR